MENKTAGDNGNWAEGVTSETKTAREIDRGKERRERTGNYQWNCRACILSAVLTSQPCVRLFQLQQVSTVDMGHNVAQAQQETVALAQVKLLTCKQARGGHVFTAIPRLSHQHPPFTNKCCER